MAEGRTAEEGDRKHALLPYPPEFYAQLGPGARSSAEAVLPRVFEIVRPCSVADVGCGTAIWLSVARDLGAAKVLGIDGPHIDTASLEVPGDCFQAANLERPFRTAETFDLVLSLEVAEHLAPESAGSFIDTLTGLGPVILFSAAIPFQGGIHHVNEQWPAYWVELFRARGFDPVDILRREFWQNEHVDWWYRQNLLLFIRHDHMAKYPELNEQSRQVCLPLVHPENFLDHAREASRGKHALLRPLIGLLSTYLRRVRGQRSD